MNDRVARALLCVDCIIIAMIMIVSIRMATTITTIMSLATIIE